MPAQTKIAQISPMVLISEVERSKMHSQTMKMDLISTKLSLNTIKLHLMSNRKKQNSQKTINQQKILFNNLYNCL